MVSEDPAYKVSENLNPYIAIGTMEVIITSPAFQSTLVQTS